MIFRQSDMYNRKSWYNELKIDVRGGIIPSISNIACILRNDDNLKNIVYNSLTFVMDVRGEVPWNREKSGWSDTDMACLNLYLDQEYGIYAPAKCREALYACLINERQYHPIKAYLESCVWDGVKRVEELLIRYLGAEDSLYVREVTKKTLVAAISRIYNRGIKFDAVLVLCGPQGIGKSTLFSRLGGKWYSDSLTMEDMRDKTAAEKLQGIWIMELGELAGMKKVDVEIVKSFISRTDDKYRPTYGLSVEEHPRSSIIVGSTNSHNGFLRDITGNRRFWPVNVSGDSDEKIWNISDWEVQMIWAEAKTLYNQGETLYLSEDMENVAKLEQRKVIEHDPRQGIIEEYLEGKQIVCLMQIWCECFERARQDMKKKDAYEIEEILQQIGNWQLYSENSSGKMRIKGYGIQRAYVRNMCEE